MSYTANQYNYATPLSSTANLTSAAHAVDVKYFTLNNNILDGSYYPIVDDVGLWGSSIAGDNGILPEPFIVTVVEPATLRSILLIGSTDSFPVEFEVAFYNGDTLLYTLVEKANTKPVYSAILDSPLNVTSYTITITRISASGVARLYNTYAPVILTSSDTLGVNSANESCYVIEALLKLGFDKLLLNAREGISSVRNTFASSDVASVKELSNVNLTNVHSVMKAPSRRVYGKVSITYTDPLLYGETYVLDGSYAYNSQPSQLFDGKTVAARNVFTLYDNDLTGAYVAGDSNSQVGWVSNVLSGTNGYFDAAPQLTISVEPRPIINPTIVFDASSGSLVENFSVEFIDGKGASKTIRINDNVNSTVTIPGNFTDTRLIKITVLKVAQANRPAVVLDLPIISTVLYTGYQDESNLMSIEMLEELTYEDDVEALGGISANEVTVVLDNSTGAFNFNNPDSLVAAQMKRNRRIEPWLGTEIVPGTIEWYKLGTYWSYKWHVPVGSLTASVVGFDTLGLLNTTDFTRHHTQLNKSLGQLVEYILDDAKSTFTFLKYIIDPALYEIVIPYAWFEPKSHTAALRKLSECFPMHVYCDRNGTINAAPQRLRLTSYVDTWSDSTNVINKEYDSIYTTLPNVVNVTVCNVRELPAAKLVEEDIEFDVQDFPRKTLNFSAPYISDIAIEVDCDLGVSYTYEVYSWGIIFSFTGVGSVRSITCYGSSVSVVSTAVVTQRDNDSAMLNGIVTRDISSDFIQTTKHAALLINRLLSLSEYDRYDVSVDYRGDISLSINDPIRLLDGIAPDNRYNIKRHRLYWNGALSGSADLNT